MRCTFLFYFSCYLWKSIFTTKFNSKWHNILEHQITQNSESPETKDNALYNSRPICLYERLTTIKNPVKIQTTLFRLLNIQLSQERSKFQGKNIYRLGLL